MVPLHYSCSQNNPTNGAIFALERLVLHWPLNHPSITCCGRNLDQGPIDWFEHPITNPDVVMSAVAFLALEFVVQQMVVQPLVLQAV